jgi:hypothetical protein
MQGVRSSSVTKKLVGVNMSSTLSGFGKASKVNEFVLEMDNYHVAKRPEVDNKVSKAVTLF